jgi:hypothetical protein
MPPLFKADPRLEKAGDAQGLPHQEDTKRSAEGKRKGQLFCSGEFFKGKGIMKKNVAIVLLISSFPAFFAMVGTAGAASSDLYTLIHQGGSITVYDKTFSDFAYSTGPINAPAAAGAIAVTPITTSYGTPPANEYGLTFDSPLGPAVPIAYTHWPLGTLTETISFNVSSSGGPIDDVLLSFEGAYSGSGSASVTEQVYYEGNPVLTMGPGNGLSVYSSSNTGTQSTAYASLLPDTYTNLTIVDTITVSAGSAFNGSGSVFSVSSEVSQVPEPPFLLLFAPGLLGLVGMKKRVFR